MDVQLLTSYEKSQIAERQPLPERYLGLSDEEMDARLGVAKAALGERLALDELGLLVGGQELDVHGRRGSSQRPELSRVCENSIVLRRA